MYARIVSQCVRRHRCYEVKAIGTGAVLIAGSSASAVASCAAALAADLQRKDWRQLLSSKKDKDDISTNSSVCSFSQHSSTGGRSRSVARSAHSGDCRGTVRTPLDSMNSSNSRRNLI
eukprot:PhM_4_TR9132/c0_g1_i1/m.34647